VEGIALQDLVWILGRKLPGRSFWPRNRQGFARRRRDSAGEIDLGLIEDTRRNWPFLRDRALMPMHHYQRFSIR